MKRKLMITVLFSWAMHPGNQATADHFRRQWLKQDWKTLEGERQAIAYFPGFWISMTALSPKSIRQRAIPAFLL
jgi:hypothetical protein